MRFAPAGLVFLLLLSACGEKRAENADAAPPVPADLLILHADDLARMDIAIDTVEGGGGASSLSIPGSVILDPLRIARISSLLDGRIRAIHVRPGARVAKNAVLLDIECPELGEMTAELIRATADEQVTRAEHERVRALHAERVVSDRELQSAQGAETSAQMRVYAARKRLLAVGMSDADLQSLLAKPGDFDPVLRLRSPIAGSIASLSAGLGARASMDDELALVVDNSTVTVEAGAFMDDFERLRTGLPVAFETKAYPGRRFTGTIASVGSVLDASTRALPLRCAISNSEGLLRPNLPGTLTVDFPVSEFGVSIPATALIRDGTKTFVFRRTNDSTFVYTNITVSAERRERIEVASGLAPGDRIVSKNAFILKSQLKLSQESDE